MRRTHLCYSTAATKACNLLPSNVGRQELIDSLIKAYNLHHLCNLVDISKATKHDLCSFHDEGFVNELLKPRKPRTQSQTNEKTAASANTNGEEEEVLKSTGISANEELYGLRDDCPVFAKLDEYVGYTAGASISAARSLSAVVASTSPGDSSSFCQHVFLNWYGGRHHCSRSCASGFCYVNDIVLAILELRKTFRKVFYLDLDIHHGDGVEDAFKFSKNVITCSVHRYDIGFFPGTGGRSSPGAYNVPTNRGLSNSTFSSLLERAITPLIENISPQVVVIQCGSDGMASDPVGDWNLTIRGFASSVSKLMSQLKNTHFLLLGGGGYNHTEAAKFAAWLTKTVVGDDTQWSEIPDHEHFEAYEKDGFRFWTTSNTQGKPGRRDENSDLLNSARKDFALG